VSVRRTRAAPVAKFTSASVTPGCFSSVRWTRAAQEPQVIPSTGRCSSRGEVSVEAIGGS